MWNPRNLILGLVLGVFLASSYGAAKEFDVEAFKNFFKEHHSNTPTLKHDILVKQEVSNATLAKHRSKRSAGPDFRRPQQQGMMRPNVDAMSLNSGTTQCWIPGYTGAHCEFPICQQLNRHEHQQGPKRVGIEYQQHDYVDMPTWFNVDTSLSVIWVEIECDAKVNPQVILYDQYYNTINPISISSGDGYLVILQYNVIGNPGLFMVQAYSASNNQTLTRTTVYAVSEIGLDVEMGFVVNNGSNQPERYDFPDSYAYQYQLDVVIADVTNLDLPGSLSTVTIYSNNGELTVPSPMRVRYGCQYKYFFDSFFCRTMGNYYARFEGYDFFGYSYTRWAQFECLPPPITQVPPTQTPGPTPTNPTGCQNFGVLITKNNGQTSCYCQGLWTGLTCNIPLCANGGTMMPEGYCRCPEGWYGQHCENIDCPDDAGLGYQLRDPIIPLVIRVRKLTGPVIKQIAIALKALESKYQFDPGYFSKFSLAFFNNQFLGVNDFNSVDQVIQVLQLYENSTDISGGCRDIVFESLWETVNQVQISKKSPIYVITDALPNDYRNFSEAIYQKNSFWNAPINFIYLETDPTNCPTDFHDPAFREMERMSERSAGLAHFVPNAKLNDVGNLFFWNVYETYYKAHLMYTDDEKHCYNQPLYETISLDYNDRLWKVVFLIIGENVTLDLVDPNQNYVTPTLVYSAGRTFIFETIELVRGQWTFQVKTASPGSFCQIRVWAIEFEFNNQAYEDYNLVWGTTPYITSDGPWRELAWKYNAHIVAHIDNYPNRTQDRPYFPEFVNAEMSIYGQTDNGRQFVMASNGIWRSGCSMQLFFPINSAVTCPTPDQLLYLTVYVRDQRGYMIQRSGVMYCAFFFSTPSPQPPNGTCEHGGIFQNGTCICPPGWTGQYCETPICYNGGTLYGNRYCNCLPGFGGDNCQFVQCIQPNTHPGFDTKHRSLAFLLDITKYNAGNLYNLARTVQQTISDIRNQEYEWIENVYIYIYNSKNATFLLSAQIWDEGAIVGAFNQAGDYAARGDGGCEVKTYTALMAVMPYLARNSYIYVYQAALPDPYDFGALYEAAYWIEERRHMLMVFGVQDVAHKFGPTTCNGTLMEYEELYRLAEASQGRFFNLRSAATPDTLKLLPTMYSSGVVYRKHIENCTQNNTIFAPMDSFSQSMQIILRGQQVTANVYLPNGQQVPSIYIGNYLNDNINGWHIMDIRRPCDEGWQNNNNPNLPYCFNVQSQKFSWDDARRFCHNAGAFLVDDNNAYIDNFTKVIGGDSNDFWIGLNDRNNTGAWFWDRGRYNLQATANFTSFSIWAPNQNLTDPAKRCVYRKGKWFVDSCQTQRYFICMKPKYSADFIPNNLDDEDIPAGRWAITLSSANGSCDVEVKTQSSTQIFQGYVNELHNDFPQPNPTMGSISNRLASYMPGFDPYAESNVPFLESAQILDLRSSSLLAAATYQYRTECAYQFLSQNWTCNRGVSEHFSVLHTGKDSRGIPFQRMFTGHCQRQMVCGNNGVLQNGLCFCDQYWTGPNCTQPICVNGGTLNADNRTCHCAWGFAGPACQYEQCMNTNTHPFVYYNKTFMLVLEKTVQNQPAIQTLSENLGSIILSFGSQWFSSFAITVFDSKGVISTKTATNQKDFEKAFNDSITGITDPGNCTLPIFSALLAAAQATGISIAEGSVQYLVTAGAPSDSDVIVGYQNYFGAMSQYQLKLYYILTTSTTTKCSTNPNERHINTLVDYAYGSDGDFVIVTQSDVGAHAATYIPTIVNSTVVGSPTSYPGQNYTCTNMIYYFEIDRHVQQIFFSSYIISQKANQTLISLIGPQGDPIPVEEMYHDANTHWLYKATPKGQGIYTVTVTDNSLQTCLIQIRTDGGLRYYTGYINADGPAAIVAGNLDNATYVPMGEKNVLLVRTDYGDSGDFARLTYAEIFNPWDGVRTLVSFYPRDPQSCSYQFFSDVFACQDKGLLIHIYGWDDHAQPFRRSTYTRCAAYISGNATTGPHTQAATTKAVTQAVTQGPKSTPTKGATIPPTHSVFFALNVDLVFIFDISSAVSTQQFKELTTFFLNTFNTFNIATGPNNPNGIHFAVLGVPGDSSDWQGYLRFAGNFDTITSYTQLNMTFSQTFVDPSVDPPIAAGQSQLGTATAYADSANVKNLGYRSNLKNHLIIYVTTTSAPNTDAINAAHKIRQAKDYGFLAFAYQANGVNSAALSSYVGGDPCLYKPNGPADLNDALGKQLAIQIFNATQNTNGVYC